MNDFRVPIHSTVTFTFSRDIKLNENGEEVETPVDPESEPVATPAAAPEDAPQPQSAPPPTFQSPPEKNEAPEMPSFTRQSSLHDIDEDDYVPPYDTSSFDPEEPEPASEPVVPPKRKSISHQNSFATMDPAVRMVSLQAENEELLQDIEVLRNQLSEALKQNEAYKVEMADLREQLSAAQKEKRTFLQQVITSRLCFY